MQSLAGLIADLIGADRVYGYLIIGILIGIVLGALVVRPSRAASARGEIGGGLSRGGVPGRSSAVSKVDMRTMSHASVDLEVNGQKVNVSPEAMAQVRQLSSDGKKIEAIKVLREATGLGLAEAKSLVDMMERTASLRS